MAQPPPKVSWLEVEGATSYQFYLHTPDAPRVPPTVPAPPTVLSVQYLRGLAALAVALAHIAHGSFEIGVFGVDVFFVISGFIMWTITTERPARPGAFLLDRATRVAPPYMLLTVLVAGVAVLVPSAFPHMRLALTHFLLSLLFIPHRDGYGNWFPVIIPGWTLLYEAGFYLLFAACLYVPQRYRALACVFALELCWIASGRFRVVEFGFGVVLAEFGGSLVTAVEARMPRWRPGLLLGDASYGIYLTHVFTAAAVWRVLGPVSVPLTIVVALVASVAVGVVWWRVVERPLTAALRSLLPKR